MSLSILVRNSLTSNRYLIKNALKLASLSHYYSYNGHLTLARNKFAASNYKPELSECGRRSLRTTQVVHGALGSNVTKLWVFERFISAALPFVIFLDLSFPNKLFDLIVIATVVPHLHWGMESVDTDYSRQKIFRPFGQYFKYIVYMTTTITLGGLLYIVIRDIGIGRTVRGFWGIGKSKK